MQPKSILSSHPLINWVCYQSFSFSFVSMLFTFFAMPNNDATTTSTCSSKKIKLTWSILTPPVDSIIALYPNVWPPLSPSVPLKKALLLAAWVSPDPMATPGTLEASHVTRSWFSDKDKDLDDEQCDDSPPPLCSQSNLKDPAPATRKQKKVNYCPCKGCLLHLEPEEPPNGIRGKFLVYSSFLP